MEGNFCRSNPCVEPNEDALIKQKSSPISARPGVPLNESGCFECNICLDTAQDPVVTLCGHLYCWPCIYKWLHVQGSADSDQQQHNCPVCKANISTSSLVPLYGRGMCASEFGSRKRDMDVSIPRRPPPSGLNSLIRPAPTLDPSEQLHQAHSPTFRQQQYFPRYYGGYTRMASTNLGVPAATSFSHPMIGMFGEMVYATIFGTCTNIFPHPYQNTRALIGSNSQRMRRQEMLLDKSLDRVSIFLLCCIILCLLLF